MVRRSNRSLVSAGLLGVAMTGLIAWLAIRSGETAGSPSEATQLDTHAVSGTDDASPAEVSAASVRRDIARSDRTAIRGGPERQAGVEPIRAFEIRLVDTQGQPRPDAEAVVLPRETSGQSIAVWGADSTVWNEPRVRPTPEGHIVVDIVAGSAARVVARTLDYRLWGYVAIPRDAGPAPHDLTLRPDLTLTVRVIGPGGSAVVGLPVRLEDDTEPDRDRHNNTVLRTDDAGLAVFAHAQQLMPASWNRSGRLVACVPPPGAVNSGSVVTSHQFSLDAPPTGPVTLRLGAHGSVRVRLVDRSGAAIPGGVPGAEGLVDASGTWNERPMVGNDVLRFRDGILDLHGVNVGARIALQVNTVELTGSVEFDGPRTHGEEMEVELVCARHPRLRGRLVDEYGTPQAGRWVASVLRTGRAEGNEVEFTSGDDGRFDAVVSGLGARAPRDERVVSIAPLTEVGGRDALPTAHLARIDLTGIDLQPGPNELGDLVLRAAPVLVAGHVVDAAGAPIEGVLLELEQVTPHGASWLGPVRLSTQGRSDADGSFVLRGAHVGAAVALRGELDGHRGPALRCEIGTKDVRYELVRPGAMRVTLATGPDSDVVDRQLIESFYFVLTHRGTGRVEGQPGSAAAAEAFLEWNGLPPGVYDFEARPLGSPAASATVQEIEIVGGETTHVPTVRLDADFHALQITVVDAGGAAIQNASVVVNPEALGLRPRAALFAKDGSVVVRTPRVPVDLLVFASGYATRQVQSVAAGQKITLEHGIVVRFEVALAGDIEAEPAGVFASLTPILIGLDPAQPDAAVWERTRRHGITAAPGVIPWAPLTDRFFVGWSAKPDRAGRFELRAPGPGQYALEWLRWHQGEAQLLGSRGRTTFAVPAGGADLGVIRSTLTAVDLR